MTLLLSGLALLGLAALAIAVWWLRSGADPAGAPRRDAPARPAAPAAATPTAAAPQRVAISAPAPAELMAFHRVAASALAPERRQAVLALFRHVPRPPGLLHHLLSPEYLHAAESRQLVELIGTEPLIAAQVLKAVNSPIYALRTPVHSVGHAVTFLGLNAVRSLCLQYVLVDAFKADSPERQQVLQRTWCASALASELAQQLGHRLGWSNAGIVSSAVVLSFLGRLATAAAMPRGLLPDIPERDLLRRSVAEQTAMGLCAGEVGRLLMADWGLPEGVASEAADIDRLLVTPNAHAQAQVRHRQALGYVCARLGERLACAELETLTDFEFVIDQEPEWFHLHAYLSDPRLARLQDHLRQPALSAALQRIRQAWQPQLATRSERQRAQAVDA